VIGILALQGDFEAHAKALSRAGLDNREVRTAAEIRDSAGLVLPGGETTAMWRLMEGSGIPAAIAEVAASGRPIFATCAGSILLARHVRNPDREGLDLLDVVVTRNAYGRQLDSAVVRLTDLDRNVLGDEPLEAVFIRAPKLSGLGPGIEVLARRDGDPVLVRKANILAATFHPELSHDPRVHEVFRALVASSREASSVTTLATVTNGAQDPQLTAVAR
jgi:5'-phosphate synthase pdxT subunit